MNVFCDSVKNYFAGCDDFNAEKLAAIGENNYFEYKSGDSKVTLKTMQAAGGTQECTYIGEKEHPNALVAVHPECKPEVLGEADYIGSTSGIIDYIVGNDAKEFIVGTVDGVYATILKQVPDKKLYNVVRTQVCPNMKLNSLEKIIHVLETGENEVFLDEEFMNKAKAPLERMLELAK